MTYLVLWKIQYQNFVASKQIFNEFCQGYTKITT